MTSQPSSLNHETFEYRFRPVGAPVEGTIRVSLGPIRSGHLLIARSDAGLCAILPGEDAQALRESLAAAFPGRRIEEDAAGLAEELRAMSAWFDGSGPRPPIPLDVGGTLFQQQVWRALGTIPAGRTRSYAEVARALGRPRAARAVAGACAANLLAVAVPCHRVVRADGAPAGYRWGAARREALLAGEGRR